MKTPFKLDSIKSENDLSHQGKALLEAARKAQSEGKTIISRRYNICPTWGEDTEFTLAISNNCCCPITSFLLGTPVNHAIIAEQGYFLHFQIAHKLNTSSDYFDGFISGFDYDNGTYILKDWFGDCIVSKPEIWFLGVSEGYFMRDLLLK